MSTLEALIETGARDSFSNRWDERTITCPRCHGAGECDYLVTKLVNQRTISPPYERDECGRCCLSGKVIVYTCQFCLKQVDADNFDGPETECECGDIDEFVERVKREELPR